MPHYLQFDSNMMNPSRIRRCMLEPEEIGSKNTEEKECLGGILQGCEFSQLANFRNIAPAPVDCFLTHLFVVLYKFTLDVILVL